MESDDNVSGEFQRSTRMPLDAVVRLHFQGTVAYQNGFAANVSATGMFVKHPAPPPLGTQLVFEFNLGAERKPVQGAGEVVWVRDKYLGPGQPAGVGIRFLQLDSQSRDHIAEALFEYLEQSLTEDSLLDSSGYSFATDSLAPQSASAGEGYSAQTIPPTLPMTPAPLAASAPRAPFAPLDQIPSPISADSHDLAEYGDSYGAPADISPAPSPTAEPFDFAALERLPPPAGPTPPAEAKRAFSVFSSLDEADSQTADIVREALRDEAPLPMMAAAAAASSEREGSRAWLGLLGLLVLVAGGGYLAFREWGADGLDQRSSGGAASTADTPEPAPPVARKPDLLNAAPAPGTTLAESVGVDPNSRSPAAAPPHSAASTAPPEEPSDVGVAREERAETAGDTPASAAPATAEPQSAAAADLPRPPAPPEATAALAAAVPSATGAAATPERAERLTGIAWRDSGAAAGETVLVLAGDAAFATGSFSYSEIGGENPRVLIKLKGMQSPYRGPAPRAPQAGGALVRGVRTGFHVTAGGNEIHVVVDLARGGVKVVSLAPAADGLTLTLAP